MIHKKLILFIDDKNIYMGARRAFFTDTDPHYYGQINPIELGNLNCKQRNEWLRPGYRVHE